MRTRKVLALIAALAVPACCIADASDDRCPRLPEGSGLHWTHDDGPDFVVCFAATEASVATVLGVYLGTAPSFYPETEEPIADGNVGGTAVHWYRKKATRQNQVNPVAETLDRQTIVPLDKDGHQVAHVWVFADTPEQLEQRLAVLRKVEFKR